MFSSKPVACAAMVIFVCCVVSRETLPLMGQLIPTRFNKQPAQANTTEITAVDTPDTE